MKQQHWRNYLLWVLILPTIVLTPVMLRFHAISCGDSEIPPRIAYLKAWAAGQTGFWTLHAEGGHILLGMTGGPLFFTDFLYLLVEPYIASNVALILQLTLAGAGFFLWRTLERKDSPATAFFGAMTYELSSYAISRITIGHEYVTILYGMFPWALWLTEKLVKREWKIFLLCFPWVFFQMALASYPGPTIALGFIMGFYLLFCLREQGLWWPSLPIWVLGMSLGLAFAAVIYYPGFKFAHEAVFAGHPDFNIKDYRYHITFPVLGMISLVLPFFFGEDISMPGSYLKFLSPANTGNFHEFAIYIGILPMIGIWLFRKMLFKDRQFLFWSFCLLFTLILSFGKWGCVYPIFSRLPVLENLRGPARFLISAPLILSVCAVLFSKHLENLGSLEFSIFWRKTGKILIGLSVISLAYLVAVSCPWESWLKTSDALEKQLSPILIDYVRPAAWINLRQIILVTALFGCITFLLRKRSMPLILMALTFQGADLMVNGYPLLWRGGYTYGMYSESWPVREIIKKETIAERSRFMGCQVLPPFTALLDGTYSTADNFNLHLRWYQELINAGEKRFGIYDIYDFNHYNPDTPLTELLRVRIYLSAKPPDMAHWTEIARINHYGVYRRNEIPPPFYFSPSQKVIPNSKERLKSITTKERNPIADTILEEPLEPPLDPSPLLPEVKGVKWVEEPPGAIVKLNNPGAGLLCSDLTYHANWKAHDQDGELRTIRINHALLGIITNPTTQEVQIKFDAIEHWIGLKISVAALGLWILITFGLTLISLRAPR